MNTILRSMNRNNSREFSDFHIDHIVRQQKSNTKRDRRGSTLLLIPANASRLEFIVLIHRLKQTVNNLSPRWTEQLLLDRLSQRGRRMGDMFRWLETEFLVATCSVFADCISCINNWETSWAVIAFVLRPVETNSRETGLL